jgi:hypothetical protein
MSPQDLERAFSGFSRLKTTTARSIMAFHEARRRGDGTARIKAAS